MPINLSSSKLILVEGRSDKAFFKALLSDRAISDFDVLSPCDMGQQYEGEDAIKILLNTLPTNRNFDKIKKILIVVDSDNNFEDKFKKFQKIISETDILSGRIGKYPVPTQLNVFATAENCPEVAISLLPTNSSNGAMETLCLQAALPNFPKIKSCIDSFVTCIKADEWSPQKNSKLKLRILISSQYSKNPDLPTTKLWEVAPNIVPIDSNVFDGLANFLEGI